MQKHAPTIYAYGSVEELLEAEDRGGRKAALPKPDGRPVTERPEPPGRDTSLLSRGPAQTASGRAAAPAHRS